MVLSIVIISWNTRKLLDACLASIYRETPNLSFEILVVDNASTDQTETLIRNKYPLVKLTINPTNRGFAAANNNAFKQARGRYILILNPDTIILNQALEKAIKLMETRPDIGLLGVKTLNFDGTLQKTVRSDPGFWDQILILTKLRHLFPNHPALKKYYRADFDYTREAKVEQLQGSFLLLPKATLEKMAYFDKNFFLWFEEVDLCRRLRNAGYSLFYSPEISIMHHGGESFRQLTTVAKQKIYNRSLIYFFKKHRRLLPCLGVAALHLPSLAIAGLLGRARRPA